MKEKTTLGKVPVGLMFSFAEQPDIIFVKCPNAVHSEFVSSFAFADCSHIDDAEAIYHVFNAYNGMEVYL